MGGRPGASRRLLRLVSEELEMDMDSEEDAEGRQAAERSEWVQLASSWAGVRVM